MIVAQLALAARQSALQALRVDEDGLKIQGGLTKQPGQVSK